ncbi:MAG: monovalent cation/H+ antiporter complex subunit F [Bacteroidota bacterium]
MVKILLLIAGALMLASLLVALYRFIKGPSVPDRVVSFDVMTVSSIAIIGMISYFSGRIIYLDIALVYGLLSFLGVIIVGRFIEKGL